MEKFLQRIDMSSQQDMLRIKRSNIHLVSTFPMEALEPEFLWGCANHFDAKSRMVEDADGKVVFSLHLDVIEKIFKVPKSLECIVLIKEKSL